VDPAPTYPEDWVGFRLTGFRPSIDDPSLIVGQALLSDLSAVIEHLTEYGGCTAADVPAPALGYPELSERWSVSRRTIDRYRRRGLVAFRIRTHSGATRLLFPEPWVRRFEEREPDLLSRARTFHHVPDDETSRMVNAARALLADTPLPLTRVAEVLAPKFGRAPETVRQVIIRYDEAAPDPLFRHPETLDGEARAAIARGFEEGEPIAALCRRHHRSRATIYRIVNERRAEILRSAAPDRDPAGDTTDIDRLLTPASVSEGLDALPELEAAGFIEAARADGPVPAREEAQRAAAARALEARAARAIASLPRYDPPARHLDRAETDLRWVFLLRVAMLQTQRALMLKTLQQRLGCPLSDLPGARIRHLHAACFRAAAEAVRYFEPTRGGRLAAPVSLALNRVLATLDLAPAGEGARRAATSHVHLEDWRPHLSPIHIALFPAERWREEREGLSADVARVLSLRFGWYGGPPRTVDEAAAILDLSPRRVRSLQRKALRP
ncbi:MAG: hypothetical protein KDA21_01005, partial [Phycisphaerales bacterium]|nr:hypothetical protein [Phycisphaerales bacterium]